MKATFAFLASTKVRSWVRKLAWEIHQRYRIATIDCCLLPHISLKQPFENLDIVALEDGMNELSLTNRWQL